MNRICFWSVADGAYAYMLKTLVHSFRAVGMQEDFHAFADQEIPGAATHLLEKFDKSFFHFKLDLLQNRVKNLDYDFFIFLDADNYFVRKPGHLLDLMEDSPFHSFLEGDCCLESNVRKEWHYCPLHTYVQFMRECGVTSKQICTMNAGFFMIKKEAIDTVCGLAQDFWKHCANAGYLFTEEAPLAYATQMLACDLEKHLLSHCRDIWASDWTGIFTDRLPDGKAWAFTDYMNHARFEVNPAIVHALKSKEILIQQGKKIYEKAKFYA